MFGTRKIRAQTLQVKPNCKISLAAIVFRKFKKNCVRVYIIRSRNSEGRL